MKKKPVIRVGMKVRSIYNPEHVFTLDRSIQPDRIFREKGTRTWWTAQELRGVKRKPVPLSATKKKQAVKSRSVAFLRPSQGTVSKSTPTYKRTCFNCGTEFESKRKEALFCQTRGASCRAEYWKRRHQPPEIPKQRLRSQKGGDSGEQRQEERNQEETEA